MRIKKRIISINIEGQIVVANLFCSPILVNVILLLFVFDLLLMVIYSLLDKYVGLSNTGYQSLDN